MWFNRIFKSSVGKANNFEILVSNKEKFISVLSTIASLLKANDNAGQAHFINGLIEQVNIDELHSFIKCINGIDMWGGSGAVWEVYIKDEKTAKDFERKMLELIFLMEETKILGSGIEPIKKLFEQNLT